MKSKGTFSLSSICPSQSRSVVVLDSLRLPIQRTLKVCVPAPAEFILQRVVSRINEEEEQGQTSIVPELPLGASWTDTKNAWRESTDK